MVKQGTRSVGNASKAERPTHYAKGGRKGNMIAQPCPCILKSKAKVEIKDASKKSSQKIR